ncbi:hypothetical protein LTY36_04060 [Limosilactobacillus agrestis]|uniref:Replication protein n=1 Tax=Limosilactobacillus agrestis TaxID=2759748 RepID=A0ABS8R7K5_9LACO|nr:Rep family protein [Limosilactobacillus agrestis]MBB1099593.1 hypothetical protein [Limosilactobacillus agrestis]MCD7127223.1 hypothetical protein [Limosilactobacillus agrestis]MCD7130362.1 hypothetical protein [Limosilactobacillus agrestis]
MGEAKKTPRSAVMMFVQQEEYFEDKNNPLEYLRRCCKTLEKEHDLYQWAIIKHDRDVDIEGNMVKPHFHIGLVFNKRVSVSVAAKAFHTTSEHFAIFTKRGTSTKMAAINVMLYLCHRTKNSAKKYQYDLNTVTANFNYVRYVENVQSNYDGFQLLDQVSGGLLSYEKAKDIFRAKGAKIFLQFSKKLDDIKDDLDEQNYKDWVRTKKQAGKPLKTVWLSGPSGLGKTRYAVDFARVNALSCFVTSGWRDPFENYNGQKVLILDEIRPHSVNYQDLLQLLDPYNFEKMLSARYHNVLFKSDVIIVTSVYSPLDFYQELNVSDKKIDTFDQLNRRLGSISFFTDSEVQEIQYLRKTTSSEWRYKKLSSFQNKYRHKSKKQLQRFSLHDLNKYAEQLNKQGGD